MKACKRRCSMQIADARPPQGQAGGSDGGNPSRQLT